MKHSTFTSWNCSCCSRLFYLRGIMLFSTFLLFFISSGKLMISSFSSIFSDVLYKSFSFNIVTLWAVAWVKVVDAMVTFTDSSSILSNKTSFSCTFFIVPLFCFTLRTLFPLTSFLQRLKVKASKIYSIL